MVSVGRREEIEIIPSNLPHNNNEGGDHNYNLMKEDQGTIETMGLGFLTPCFADKNTESRTRT